MVPDVKLPGPQVSTKEAIGITVAIVGNILISFSLNLQKLAHRRLDLERENTPPDRGTASDTHTADASEAEPLLSSSHPEARTKHAYGTSQNSGRLLQFSSFNASFQGESSQTQAEPPVDLAASEPAPELSTSSSSSTLADSRGDPLPLQRRSSSRRKTLRRQGSGGSTKEGSQEGAYLRSKLWWLGFLLMNLGETGNFISYGFAPASVVAPLGTFALIANCLFAPLLLKERFRKLDLLGILIAVIGAVTVVLSSNPSDSQLGPQALLDAISHPAFVVYAALYAVGALALAGLSERSPGDIGGTGTLRWLVVDVGLCALFGGFTVLSTKAISTLLTTLGYKVFTEWITYPLLLILGGTGVGQIRYLNRALMRFDSKIVIPSQFVLFNLSAIVGSAILYGDFRKATFHQMVTFLYGCGATFVGVFIIAWTPGQVGNGGNEPEEDQDTALSIQTPERRGGVAESGSRRRRNHATLIVPNDQAVLALHPKPNAVSLVGLAPAQRLLLVHSPPRHDAHLHDVELGQQAGHPRAITWYGDRPGARAERRRQEDEAEGDGTALRSRSAERARTSDVVIFGRHVD